MWSTARQMVALILLSTLSKGLPEDDFRIINKQDLLASDSDIFEDNSTKSFSQLLFDVARDQIVVGARDAIYRLSLRGLRQLERADWPAPPDKTQLCQDKGQTEEDCHNHIKVLLSYGHKLFACGTYAYSPLCSLRQIESISSVLQYSSGVAHCPYSPSARSTALLASSGEYYAGTSADFSSSDIAICRSRGASHRNVPFLRTPQYEGWLNEPQFVASFDDDNFVYFVFREVAVEFLNCGKIIYSRIGRVCKNDSGGHLMLRENWSTFLKARLNCSIPGDLPFYYDEVQSAEYLPQEKLLVATFTTPSNSIAGSAVCIYNMSDITAAFEGPYKVQEHPTSLWGPRAPSQQARDHFRCITDTRPQHLIEYYNSYYLMYDSVQPSTGAPIYQATLERFTHTTVDVAHSKNIGKQLVVFVATEENEVWKLSVLPRLDGACLVEKWMLNDKEGGFNVLTMQFVKETMSIYIGSVKSVVRLIAFRCERYKSRATCLASNDPHCGWDGLRDQCVEATSRTHDEHLVQDTSVCASQDTIVDGGWSSWSSWEPCEQDSSGRPSYDDRRDLCRCRARRCDNPRPRYGGSMCQGASISVTNCTVHGGWSAWSSWSSCSATCGIAVKTRRRACVAPEPAFGGRECVGLDSQELYCTSLPPCPDPALEPVDGGWSPWGPWTPCSSEGGPGCGPGAGWKERKRTCNNPTPKFGGSDCEGSKVERQICDLRACEVRKATAWTPWVVIPDNTSDGGYTEKRFKFLCKAPSPEQVKLSVAKEEERYCTSDGSCSDAPLDNSRGSWAPWGLWGPCSASCGGGQQTRARRCRGHCRGPAEMQRPCNTHDCSGSWSCWSAWSACSGDCSSRGLRSRTRACAAPAGCAGAALERALCQDNCENEEFKWGEWGEWSSCAGGEVVRRRACVRGDCAGAHYQAAACNDQDPDNELSAMPAYSAPVEVASFITPDTSMSVGGIVGCVVSAFAFGILASLAVIIYLSRRNGSRLPWKRVRGVPSSPHYLPAKQNSYVTVPLKDVPRKPKRQPSFTGIGGTLLKSNNMNNANNHNNTLTTPKLYPKAIANEYDSMGTLRRNSNMQSHRNNLDADEDKFY